MKHHKKKRRYGKQSRQTTRKPQQTQPLQSVAMAVSNNDVIIYQSELDYISRCILDFKNIETGGQLFGL